MKIFATLTILLCVVVGTRVGHADEDADARARFLEGQSLYEAHRYPEALRSFNESYRLSRRPQLLYNIGVCQERMGQNEAAIASFELYLRDVPKSAEQDYVQARVVFLRKMAPNVAAEPVGPPPVKPEPVLSAPGVRVAPPGPPRRSRRGLAIGLSIGAVVVVGLAVGLGVGLTVGRSSTPDYTPSTLGAHAGSL